MASARLIDFDGLVDLCAIDTRESHELTDEMRLRAGIDNEALRVFAAILCAGAEQRIESGAVSAEQMLRAVFFSGFDLALRIVRADA